MSETISEAKLPVELLLLVKEHIPLSDLRTHVCFYNTCRTIAAFYGDNSQQNAFWRRACALSGIGWLRGDSSWKEIAFETIAKDGFCTHPHCGATLLGWNTAYVERAMHNHDWDPEEGAWDGTFDSEELANQWTSPSRPLPICSPIFRHIGFSRTPIPPWYSRSTDPHLWSEPAQGPVLPRDWIAAHPVASRSLATFPSVRQLRIHYLASTYGSPAQGAMGTTVWDVLRSIQHDLDTELTVRQLVHLTAGPFESVFRGRVSANFVADLERFSTLRGLLAISRWDGMLFIRSDHEGPIFRSTFSPLRMEGHWDDETNSATPQSEDIQ